MELSFFWKIRYNLLFQIWNGAPFPLPLLASLLFAPRSLPHSMCVDFYSLGLEGDEDECRVRVLARRDDG